MTISDHDDDDENFICTLNCDQLRRKVNAFLATGQMTQTAFLKKVNVNSNSFRRFMSYKGAYTGSDNGMYVSGNRFFQELEREKKEAKSKGASSSNSRKEQQEKERQFLAILESVPALESDLHLIHDDCDEVRAKILGLIERDRIMTKASFCKYLGINSNSLARFLSAGRGPFQGNENGTYTKAYFFFERKRIALNEKKTKKRLANESEHPEGFPTNRVTTLHRIYKPFMEMEGGWI